MPSSQFSWLWRIEFELCRDGGAGWIAFFPAWPKVGSGHLEHKDRVILMIFIFGGPMLVTIPVTALLCRFWVRRGRSVSYGTMIAGAGIVMVGFMILLSRGDCFGRDYWTPDYRDAHHVELDWPIPMLRFFGFTGVICALPALGVVAYYQRKGKEITGRRPIESRMSWVI
jgi:hypothetical protein